MATYTVEQIEYLRAKAYVSYEEALELLDRYGGDLTRCLVDLERRGRLKPQAGARGGERAQRARKEAREFRREGERGTDWQGILSTFLHTNLLVARSGETVANLPVLYVLLVFLFAPHVMIPSVLLLFVFGCRINLRTGRRDGRVEDELRDIVDNAAENIRKTAGSFAQAGRDAARTVRETAQAAAPQPEEGPDAEPVNPPCDEPMQEYDVQPDKERPRDGDGDESEITIG